MLDDCVPSTLFHACLHFTTTMNDTKRKPWGDRDRETKTERDVSEGVYLLYLLIFGRGKKESPLNDFFLRHSLLLFGLLSTNEKKRKPQNLKKKHRLIMWSLHS